MKRLNSAIIGCGAIHSLHAASITDCIHANLYAVCDIDTGKASDSAKVYGCKKFTEYRQLLEDPDIDIVHICTPHYLHAKMAIDAMRAGKHVLTEKPAAINASDAQEMAEVSVETGKSLGVCFQNRYNATSVRVKELLDSDKAGRILGGKAIVTWYRDAAYYASGEWRGTMDKEGGGVLINQAVHTLDLLLWFMGDAVKVKASVDNRLLIGIIEVEDTSEATIIFKNGASAIFYATNCHKVDSPVLIELVCENAEIRLESDLLIKYRDGRTERLSDNDSAAGVKAYWGCSHKTLINDFYSKIITGQKFQIDGLEGLKAVRLINACYTSNKTNKYVDL